MKIFLVLLVVGLNKVKKDGMPQLAGTVPLRAGIGVHAFLFFCICILPSRSYYENIVNLITIDTVGGVQQ